MKKIILVIILLLTLSSCKNESIIINKNEENLKIIKVTEPSYELTGTIKIINDNSVEFETVDKSPYIVFIDDVNYNINVGDLVIIEYSGIVRESYPMGIDAINIVVIEDK